MSQWFSPSVIIAIILSLSIHLFLFIFSSQYFLNKPNSKIEKMSIAVKIVKKKPVSNMTKQQKVAIRETESKKEVVREKPKIKKRSEPVQGLSPSSFSGDAVSGEGIEVREGNSLLVEDKGEKLDVKQNAVDLSADVRFLRFKKPEYTDRALEAELEGDFVVDVLVDEKGQAIEIQLRTEIGFGMDERIIKAIKNAAFSPRQDESGTFIKAWGEFIIRFELP